MDEKIIFRGGVQAGKEFQISGDEITFGRDLGSTIVLDDIQISRHHLRVYREDDNLFVEDLKSTNGSLLNGKALKKAQKLKNGDIVTMGETNVFEFRIPGEAKVEVQAEPEVAKSVKAKPAKKGKFKIERKKKRPKEVEELLEEAQPVVEKPKSKVAGKYPTWAIILLIALGFIIIFCVIPFVIIEVTDQWCSLFGNFFNAISPGVCP